MNKLASMQYLVNNQNFIYLKTALKALLAQLMPSLFATYALVLFYEHSARL